MVILKRSQRRLALVGAFLALAGSGSVSLAADMAARAKMEEKRLVYRYQGQTIVIEGSGTDGLRVRIIPEGGKQTSDWALNIPLASNATIKITPQEATIRNGKISARIHDIPARSGHMQFFRHTGDKQIPILSECDNAVDAKTPGPRTFKPAGDGLFYSELQFTARDGERFYGMGENAKDAPGKVNLKGCAIDLYQRHMKAVVPFVVSSEGYGFLWNNPSLGKVEFGTNMTRWISYGSRQLDYFVTAGDSYADLMENYADATGHAPAFPYWASGFWQCKLRYQTQAEFLNIAREFKRRGLPLSVLVIDFLHWDITGNWRLDPKFWPDPKAMVKEMNEMGVRIMISPWTLVDEKSENFAYMKEHGLFTGSIGGKKDTVDFGGPKYQYDPTNPEAARYLWSKWKANYVDLGIRTFWLDPCDEFHEIQDYDKVLFHIGPAKESHAFFVVAHQKNIYEGLLAAGENEVVTICRNAWAGSQRYGACPAPHDINNSFEDLEIYMKVGLNVMMSGIPWWSCDIGGFITPDNTSPRFHELMVRWYQYGVFLPVFRTHGCRPNNEAWTIGGMAYPHIRAAMLLREHLRPYVMEQMKLASARGLPPMRPLFFDFMDDPKAAAVEDEFLFGPDILVAPITKFGMRRREVYLPAGAEWTDAWTGKVFQGGQGIEADAPIEYIPVYIRGAKPDLLRHFQNLEMLTLSFGALDAAAIDGTNITITVPPGTDVTALAPAYTVSPWATGSPASGTPLNFNTPQVYTVTAADHSTQAYLVTVRLATIYDFNDGTLQGWHNRVWDTSSHGGTGGWTDLAPGVTSMPASINGGQIAPANTNNALFRNEGTSFMGSTATFILSGNHLDNHRNTLWLRSPEFHLDGSGDLTFQLLAGTGAGVAPTTESSVPFAAGDIETTGWIGVCLRDVTTGAFVLSANRSSRDFNNWQPLTFTAAQLAKLNRTHAYTLDLLVTGKGLWSWVGLDNVAIPGITPASSKDRKETGAKASAGAQGLKDAVKVETVASQPAWVMGNDEVELAVTQLGAHMAPVKFYRGSSAPVQPYYICPWQDEKLEDSAPPVLRVLRGDFFCMPFGANGASANGETHPPHGEPAGGTWNVVGHGKTGRVTFLEMSFKPQVRPGTITKWIRLVDGQNAIYTQEILSGFKGPMPLGHHATLAVPEKQGSLRVATSPFAFGMTCPVLFSDPRNREYQSFAIGKEFADLRSVPLLWKEPAEADATAFPARTGFTDLLAICRKPVWDGTPAWIAASVQQEGYLWFALKDPGVLPTTVFWISNGGRQGPPWNGRNRCLGLEDVCGFFAEGIKASCEPNVLTRKGIPTAIELSPERPTVVNYLQGLVKIPEGFVTVQSAKFEPGKVTFVSITGKQVSAAVNWEFLRTGMLP